jgi:adenylate cyclase
LPVTRRGRLVVFVGAIVLAELLVGGLASHAGWFDENLQTAVYDSLITMAAQPPKNQITIVGIDDATIERFGRWPLPHEAYAKVVRALRGARPTVIAFNVAFYDESGRPDEERHFAEEIRTAGNVFLAMQGQGTARLDPELRAWRYDHLLLPVPELREAAAGLAATNVVPDADGRVRRVPLVVSDGEQRFYSVPLLAAARQLRGDIDGIRQTDEALELPVLGARRIIPAERGADMRVYFAAKPATPLSVQRLQDATPCVRTSEMCVVSMADVLAGAVPSELLANRIVLIGAHSAGALEGSYPVPNSERAKMEGVELWANAAQTIMTGRFPLLREDTLPTLVWILAVTLVGVALIVRFGLFGFLGAIFAFIVYVAYVSASFVAAMDVPNVVRAPSVAYVSETLVWWVVVLGYMLVEEQFSVRRTQRAFGLAVTPAIARHILELDDSGKLGLGGELRDGTVLFGDIRGFTRMSEGMDAADLLATLNRYFDGMVTIVQRYEGIVNKYNGDSIMVIWNAPLAVPDHARKAVRCALELQHYVTNERQEGGPTVAFGFGINTGEFVAGFLGAQGRLEYTVIGDTVNVAARLTAIARRDNVVVSERTLRELGEDVEAFDLGFVQVKGRGEPVHCFQINRLAELTAPRRASRPAPRPAERVAGVR